VSWSPPKPAAAVAAEAEEAVSASSSLAVSERGGDPADGGRVVALLVLPSSPFLSLPLPSSLQSSFLSLLSSISVNLH